MTANIKIDTIALQGFITQYKASFSEHRLGADNEIYKWKAVKCFQDNWNIDAPDFLAMLKSALAQTGNLLANMNNFPKGMLEDLAGVKPEEVRAMFRELFDDNIDVTVRAKRFAERAAALRQYNTAWKQDYQTPNAISTYLWLRYPDKYYIYKYSVIKDSAQKLCGIDLPTGKLDRMIFGFELYDAICEELAKDAELIALSKSSLTDDCYPDNALKTLTIDIGYFISSHTSPSNAPLSVSTELSKAEASDKNIILYGTPGTGKTYSSILYAVSIIEEKRIETVKSEDYSVVYQRYLKYKDDGLIAFTTFHQSFGYEEFIEGIRPVVSSDNEYEENNKLEYEVRDGIFKDFCDKAGTPIGGGAGVDLGISKAPAVWKVSLEGTGDNPTRKECMKNNHIRIGLEGYGEAITDATDFSKHGGRAILNAFINRMQIGDIVFSCYSSKTIDAIGVIIGDAEWHNEYEHYKRLRKVKWLVKGISEDIVDLNAGKPMTLSTVYKLAVSVSDVMQILRKTSPKLFGQTVKIPNRVFIIDEINRGNISKIFGELITLLEPIKRIGASEELRAILPYSGQNFGVPDNVYVVGTMNTADRSIAMIDTALRRRFRFIEMQPDSSLLRDVLIEGIDIAEMLDTMNRRITVLLDREHTLGHSYLLPLKNNATVEMLAGIFENKIMPLLQEYFYDDYEKIQLVLGDNQKNDDSIRFIVKMTDAVKLFGNADIDYPEFYEVNREAFKRIEAYAFLN
jgi:5-methylcytosine-specific restriction protein B